MNRTAVILVFLCSLFILITLLEFYGTAQRGGNVELPHSTSITGNSVLNISRTALPAHVTPERMDLCSNRAPKNIFFDVGSNPSGERIVHENTYRRSQRISRCLF
jgi:hypothetical protein